MLQNLGANNQVQLNPVKHRLLFLSPDVEKGLHNEAKTKDFQIKAGLGQGAFGRVFKVERRSDKKVLAIKQIPKNLVKQQDMVKQIVNEVQIMYKLKHPNIIELYDHFEEEEFIYLIIEYAGGGQLWHKLNEVHRFDERTVQKFMKDITTAVEYLHSRNPPIIHRDIKPENLLLDMKGNVKLADFGWSNFFNNSKRQTYGGTLDYLAPEMIAETGHDLMLDVWSLGVLIFEFLTGQAPFTPTKKIDDPKESQAQLEKNIMSLNLKFPNDFPLLAKDLVQKILKKDPKQRLPISEIKKHPWLKDQFQPEAPLPQQVSNNTNNNPPPPQVNKVQEYKKKIEQQQQMLESQKTNTLGQSGVKNQAESPTNKAKLDLEDKLKQRQLEIAKQEDQQKQAKQQQNQLQQKDTVEDEQLINLIDSEDEEDNINVSQPLEPSQQLVNPQQFISQPPPPPEPIQHLAQPLAQPPVIQLQQPAIQPPIKSQPQQQTPAIPQSINECSDSQMKPVDLRKIRLLEHQNQMFQQEQDKMWENLRAAEDQLQKQKFEIETKQRIIDELSQIKIEKQQFQEKLKNHQESHQQQISQLQSQIEELKLKHELEQKKQELTNQTNPSKKQNGIKNFNEIIPLITTMSENLAKVIGSSQQQHNLQSTLIEYEKELASLKSQQANEFQNYKIELTDKFEDEIEQLQTKYHTELATLQEEKCQQQLQLENDVQRLTNQVTELDLENKKNKTLEKQLELERQINHESKTEWKNLQISKDMLEKDNKELKNKLMDMEEIIKNLKKQLQKK